MSPSPDSSPQSSKSASAESVQSESSFPVADPPIAERSLKNDDSSEEPKTASAGATPALRRPLTRPVSRPETPPAATPAIAKVLPAATPAAKSEPVAVAGVADRVDASTTDSSETDPATQSALRPNPIPPPSEPKQYRAIGLVYGRYTAIEDEFTRGEMVTPDGTLLKAVLLGRVMSLVRNHIDLEKDHLWVVYPRTREGEPDIHLQIVGVWEPETLDRNNDPEQAAEGQDSAAAEPTTPTDAELYDRYFSIRGEIVYVAQDQTYVVVKIQQAPRKSSDKAKAFKLPIHGKLENPRQVGYFWDFNIKLIGVTLTIMDGTCIGLAPPKKRSKDGDDRGRRKPQFGRRPPTGSAPRGNAALPRPAAGSRPVPLPKPVKRSEPASEG